MQDKIEVIKELRPVLAQCVGICPVDSTLDVAVHLQNYDPNLNMLQQNLSSMYTVRISGPSNTTENIHHEELSAYLSTIGLSIGEDTGKASYEYEFVLVYGEIEVFTDVVKQLWNKIYDRIFNEQINKVINGQPI